MNRCTFKNNINSDTPIFSIAPYYNLTLEANNTPADKIQFTHSTFERNIGYTGGFLFITSGSWMLDSNVSFTNCTFKNNYAYSKLQYLII